MPAERRDRVQRQRRRGISAAKLTQTSKNASSPRLWTALRTMLQCHHLDGIAHLTVHCVLPIVGRHDLRPKAAISVKGFTSGSSYKCAVTASNSSSEGSNSKSSDIFIALSNALSAPTSVILIPTSSQSSAAFTKGTTRTPTPYTASLTAGSTTATTSANDVCIGPSYLF